jgi:sarcosine oxidase subunit alpha
VTQAFRLAQGGRLDRSRTLNFSFDGHGYQGHPGDTLASALLANGVHFVGRSFKYHRPRGVLSAGVEEPNALVQLRQGRRSEPNVRATVAELHDGLIAESQNRWPSLAFDVGWANELAAPLLPPGFFYKTFMWPPSWRERYEAGIRRMAGLGAAPPGPDPDGYDKLWAHCDVLVAGGGPAGLSAAQAAARAGARVILADEQMEFGGALLGEAGRVGDAPAADWAEDVAAELAAMPGVTLLPRTTVFGYYDHNFLGLAERVSDHRPEPAPNQPRQRLWKVRAKQVVIATGAIERHLVFADNDRPGIMLAGAARTYANRWAVRPGGRAVVFANNDSAYRAALDLSEAGVVVAALIDVRPEAPVAADALRARGIDVLSGWVVTGTKGTTRVKSAQAMRLDGERVEGPAREFECDLLAMSGGWNPTAHLFSQSGGRLRWDGGLATWLPGEGRQKARVAGWAAGPASLAECLAQGAHAGHAAALEAGCAERDGPPVPPPVEAAAVEAPLRPLWVAPHDETKKRKARKFVDFQNDVSASDLELATREGYRSIEHVKRYTASGLGTDQGKTGNVIAGAIVAAATGGEPGATGLPTFRQPYTPVAFGAITGHDRADLLEPTRRTPMQAWHEANGAAFEPVGQWLRPLCYARAGEDRHAAVRREVKAARASLGMLDASTLGKIDLRGPDAGRALDRFYTNRFSNLGVGRSRYGLMLNEDGMIFDDGVTTRLADDHFHMTTTTGGAGAVFNWLEAWLQTEWPELKVWRSSVTEQWAVLSICGPNARRLLAELAEGIDLSNEAFPHMAMREGRVAGAPARVFRVSFTGELSYEINVPASWGLAVWLAAMTAGAKWGITPFGTDAMHVLRAEVGFVMVGQETDGTVTPIDLGLEAMVSPHKDFLGKRSLARADTARADRKQLVGLLTQDPAVVLPEGAQLVATAAAKPPLRAEGHVTSSYDSPNVGRSIAMALLARGGQRHGETVYAMYDGRLVPATVGPARFFDPEGKRARG